MAKPRTKFEASKHKPLIASLYLKGYTMASIADQLGIDVSTVSRDIKFMKEQWRQSEISDIDQLKQRELEKIDILESEAWAAWLRSQGDAITTNEFDGNKSTSTKNQFGDPRFLAQVDRCIERRCKILGIEAPVKTDNHHDGLLTVKVVREETKE